MKIYEKPWSWKEILRAMEMQIEQKSKSQAQIHDMRPYFYKDLMQVQARPYQEPFSFLQSKKLKQLVQIDKIYAKPSLGQYEKYRSTLQQPVYLFKFSRDNKSKKIIKKKDQLETFQTSVRAQFASSLQGYPPAEGGKQMESFLNKIFSIEAVSSSMIFKKFVGIRVIQNQEVWCVFQGKVALNSTSRYADRLWIKAAGKATQSLKKLFFGNSIYLVMSKTCLYLMSQEFSPQQVPQQVAIIRNKFSYQLEISIGSFFFKDALQIHLKTSQLQIDITADDITSLLLFVAVAQTKDSNKNRFNSFAPVRNDERTENVRPFIDGKDYFHSLFEELLKAEHEVYITGWVLSPHFYLKREPMDYNSKLLNVLKTIGEKGVKIYILLYNPPYDAVNNKPGEVVEAFRQINNLNIVLHPRFFNFINQKSTVFFSHHQKLVIIDKKIAYMGGLDIAFGRFDWHDHLLLDPKEERWPDVDYCNYRVSDIKHPQKLDYRSVERKQVPRMPWHDIGVRLQGSCVQDLELHFVEYWNHATDNKKKIQVEPSFETESFGLAQTQSFVAQEPDPLEEMIQQLYKEAYGQDAILEISKQELQEIRTMLNQYYQKNQEMIKKLNLAEPQALTYQEPTIPQPIEQQAENECFGMDIEEKSLSVQIVRSNSIWGVGLKQTQKSIVNAYIKLIQEATDYIYIENQFFMQFDHHIPSQICKKIIKTHNCPQKSKFKVIIMMPALPGFAGTPGPDADLSQQIQNTLNTIKKMYQRLTKELGDQKTVNSYLYFFSLRTHAAFENGPVTEIIYIHSKLMIVDDTFMIIGSANINNRSLAGDRDTQLALVVQEKDQKCLAKKMIRDLIKEHFDFSLGQEVTCFNDAWQELKSRSDGNHQIYKELFACYPDDSIEKYDQIKKQITPSSQKYQSEISKIKGHAISFQRKFLGKQDRLKLSGKAIFLTAFWNKFT